jgi:bromodomain adjacent to zinc finger domain protein 1A
MFTAICNCFVKQPIADTINFRRDRLAYSKNMLKKVIRECASKESYIGAPWIVKPALAERYHINSQLPADLQEARDKVMLKTRKRKPQGGADKEEDAHSKTKSKEEELETRKRLMSLKYPIEDLDLPVYRRPDLEKPDVTLQARAGRKITDPLGNRGLRPVASDELGVPEKQFTSFLLIWNFLTTFSKPLHLTPFSIDDFEQALHYTSTNPVSYLIIEAHVALLNTIIRERRKKNTGAASMVTGSLMVPGLGHISSRSASPAIDYSAVTTRTNTPDLETNGDVLMKDEDVSFSSDGEVVLQLERTTISEKGWGSNEAFDVGKGWSIRPIRLANDRTGWGLALIGCLNEVCDSCTMLGMKQTKQLFIESSHLPHSLQIQP